MQAEYMAGQAGRLPIQHIGVAVALECFAGLELQFFAKLEVLMRVVNLVLDQPVGRLGAVELGDDSEEFIDIVRHGTPSLARRHFGRGARQCPVRRGAVCWHAAVAKKETSRSPSPSLEQLPDWKSHTTSVAAKRPP